MKRIAITMGEPGGIGPEVAVKAVVETLKDEKYTPVLVGDPEVFKEAAHMCGIDLSGVEFISSGSAFGFKKGADTATGGLSASEAITRATGLTLGGDADAMVTAPISKRALHLAGIEFPGHTEMLADLTGTSNVAMMLMGQGLRVMLVTIHTSLRSVPDLITRDSVLGTIRLAAHASMMLSIKDPKVAVCGLNPHSGEGGMFGAEEKDHIIPAIKDAQGEGIKASGPYPADSVFKRALDKEFDIVVCMYHDQGLAPLKTIAFDTGINVTVGLPIIRTSPDHGTAYDIAWSNKADPTSMEMAIRGALRLKLMRH